MSKIELVNLDRVRRSVEVGPGTTIRECVRRLEPGRDEFLTPTICIVDGEPLLRKDWDSTTVDGHEVRFHELPMGGGGSNASMIVRAVTSVLAAVCLCIPGVGPWLAMGILLVGGIVSALLASNEVSGPRQAEAASPTYNVNASGNMARLNEPEPEGFGRIRIIPDYVAQTWGRYYDNDEYVHFIYGIGRGLYAVEKLYFGDTLFWTNDAGGGTFAPMAEQDNGWGWGAEAGIDLPHGGAWSSTVPLAPAGGGAKQGRLNIHFPRGHGQYACGTSGLFNYVPADASFEVRYTEIGSGVWSEVMPFTFEAEGAVSGGSMDGRTLDQIARAHAFTRHIDLTFSDEKRWGVQIRNTTPEISAPTPETGYEDTAAFQGAALSSVASRCPQVAVQIVPPGERLTLFETNVASAAEVSSLTLYAPNDEEYDGPLGPYAANPAGTTTERIMVDVVCPSGLSWYDDEGEVGWHHVTIRAEAQKINDEGEAVGSWFTLGTWTIEGCTSTAIRRTFEASVPEGRYQVRMVRTSNTGKHGGEERGIDDAQWTALRAVLLGQLVFPQTVVAVRAKATNVLSQASSQRFGVLATRKLPLYDVATGTWSEPTATRSWAAAVSAVCQEAWGGMLSDKQIDLQTLWNIDAILQAKNWHFDAHITQAYSLWQLIAEMCQAVLVVPRMEGTVLSFVRDEPGRPVQYELNARNIVRGSFQVTYSTWTEETPDDVIMKYLDEDANYQEREVQATIPAKKDSAGVVVRPGSESTEPVTLQWIGITNRAHAFRVAMRHSAMNRFRRVTVTCQVEGLGKVLQAGDVVNVNHPRFRDTSAGVLESWSQADPAWGNKPTLTLEKDFHQGTSGQADAFISLTRPDGSMWGPVAIEGSIHPVGTPSGRTIYKAVLDADDVAACGAPWGWLSSGTASQPTAYALHDGASGEAVFKRRMIVQSVTADDGWHYQLTLVNDAPEVDDYDTLTVPAWNARNEANTALEAPDNLAVSIDATTGAASVTWSAVSGAVRYEVQHGISVDGVPRWIHDGITPYTAKTIAGASAENLQRVRIRAFSDSHESPWAVWPEEA